MPRIRSIKPDFPYDEKMASVSREARLTFILTWTVADDDGLFRAEPRPLLGQLYPCDADVTETKLEKWLGELVSVGRIRWRETKDGARVGEIVNWSRHQKIDNRSKPFLANQLSPNSRDNSEALASGSRDTRCRSLEPRVRSLESGVSSSAPWKDFKSTYPKRSGSQRWGDAEGRFQRLVEREHLDPEMLIGKAKKYHDFCDAAGKTGTELVMQAATWLGKARAWEDDYEPPPEEPAVMGFGEEEFI